jgi:hypothetical protein
MEDFDLPDRYQTDIFRGRLEGSGLTMAESYVRFALKVFEMPSEALFTDYPQLGDCILPEDPVPSQTAEVLASMVIRHSSRVVETLRNQVSRAVNDLVPPSLPETCLVKLAMAGAVSKHPSSELPVITLTTEEELESRKQGFKGAFPVQITGRQELRTSNVVKIGATEILVPGAEFRLLLRLVVALFQNDDGFVPKGNLQGGGLGEEGIYPPHELEQAVSRLRSRLRPGLQDLDAKRYVEVRRGRIRLSTHRKFVIVDRLQLLAHDDELVRRLARQLPEN